MNTPLLDQINIVSTDLEASVTFYRRLGLAIPEQRLWRTATGLHHVSAETPTASAAIHLDLDSSRFAAVWNSGWQGNRTLQGRVVVGFKLESRSAVDAIYADLTGAGYRGLQAPYDAFWGSRYAVIEDPDGVAVGLMSPIEKRYRREPPEV